MWANSPPAEKMLEGFLVWEQFRPLCHLAVAEGSQQDGGCGIQEQEQPSEPSTSFWVFDFCLPKSHTDNQLSTSQLSL